MHQSNSRFANEYGSEGTTGSGFGGCCVNVGQTERLASAAIGGALLMSVVNFRPVRGILAAAIGGGLLYRAITGHCHLYHALGIDRAKETGNGGSSASRRMVSGMERSNRSSVDIASDDSFPASDPPAWTRSSAT